MKLRYHVISSSILFLLVSAASARIKTSKSIQHENREQYLQRMQQQVPDLSPASPGSLWTDNGKFVRFFADYKASRVGDPITIVVNQNLSAQNAGSVSTSRGLCRQLRNHALGRPLKAPRECRIFFRRLPHQSLTGKSQAATTSTLKPAWRERWSRFFPPESWWSKPNARSP